MRVQTTVFVALSLYLTSAFAIPVAEPDANTSPINDNFGLFERDHHDQRGSPQPPTAPSPPANCPTQKPIAQNLCTSGSPYCCSGTGSGQVCGPASSTSCSATTICCINTNGMQICAGEIDFTGPVTININL